MSSSPEPEVHPVQAVLKEKPYCPMLIVVLGRDHLFRVSRVEIMWKGRKA